MAKKPAHYVSDFPNLIEDWDISKNIGIQPENMATGSNKKVWWKCAVCGHEWQQCPNHDEHHTHHRGAPYRPETSAKQCASHHAVAT